MSNSVELDQTQHSVASDLGLHKFANEYPLHVFYGELEKIYFRIIVKSLLYVKQCRPCCMSNSVELDQTQHSVASDLGLHKFANEYPLHVFLWRTGKIFFQNCQIFLLNNSSGR